MMVEIQFEKLKLIGDVQVFQVLDTNEETESSIQTKLAMITTILMEMGAIQHEVSKLDGFAMELYQYVKSVEME